MNQLTFRTSGAERGIKTATEILRSFLPNRLHSEISEILADPDSGLGEYANILEQNVPREYQFLLDEVTEFEGRELEFVNFSKNLRRSSRFGMELGVGAAIHLRTVSEESGSHLVGMGLEGSFNFGAAAKQTSSVISFGYNAANQSRRKMEYLVDTQGDNIVLSSLLQFKDVLVDPSELNSLVDRLENSPLRRVVRSGSSTSTLGMEIAFGNAFERAYPEAGLNLGGQVGASLKLEYNDYANFELSVEQAEPGFVIDLQKVRKKSTSSVLKMGVDVKLVGLRQRLLDKITAVLPQGERVQELIQRLDEQVEALSEDKLRARLAEKLVDLWPDAEPVFKVIVGEQTTGELADKIREELQEKVEDAISARVDLLNDRASSAANKVAVTVTRELNLQPALTDQLKGYLFGAVEDGIGELQKSFDDVVQDLLPQDRIEDLLSPLNFLGGSVETVLSGVSGGVGATAGELSAALKQVYGRYNKFRQGIITAVQDKFQEEFSLAVIREKSRIETETHAITVTFARYEGALGELYQALWNGDLRELAKLVQAASRHGHVTCEGEYVRTVERLEHSGLNLNVFGLGLVAATVFSDTVTIGFDYNGRLIVAESVASFKKEVSFWNESQSITAEWNIDLLQMPALDTPVKIALQVKDENFKRGREIDDFFGELEQGRILRPGIGDEVETRLFRGSQRSVSNAVLAVNIPVTWAGWTTLLEIATPESVADDFLEWVAVVEPERLDDARFYMRKRGNRNLHAYIMALGSRVSEFRARSWQGMHQSGRARPRFLSAYRLGRVAHLLKVRFERAQVSWAALPRGAAAGSEPKLEELISQFNKDFASVFSTVFSIPVLDPGDISWITASAMSLFMNLDDREVSNPYLACTLKADNMDELILS